MNCFCFASRTLFSRIFGCVLTLIGIMCIPGSVCSQTAHRSYTQTHASGETSTLSSVNIPAVQTQDQPALGISPARIVAASDDVKAPDADSSGKITATSPTNLHFSQSGSAAVKFPGSETDDGNLIENSEFIKNGQKSEPAGSWRPFEGLPRQERFSESRISDDPDDPSNPPSEKFHWKDAMYQSMLIQGLQHGYALAIQEKTRRALKGPFFQDYIDSLKGLKGWDDGNKFFTNYIAHPMQGAMTGFIFLQNHDRMKKQKFGESKQYWTDRFKAFVWSTAWSTNWELGPISQSSIGNVGLYGKQGYVDLVMTPTAGTGWMIVEEAFDRYIIRHIEDRNFFVKMLARTILNPMRSVANALRFKVPWYRDRPMGH